MRPRITATSTVPRHRFDSGGAVAGSITVAAGSCDAHLQRSGGDGYPHPPACADRSETDARAYLHSRTSPPMAELRAGQAWITGVRPGWRGVSEQNEPAGTPLFLLPGLTCLSHIRPSSCAPPVDSVPSRRRPAPVISFRTLSTMMKNILIQTSASPPSAFVGRIRRHQRRSFTIAGPSTTAQLWGLAPGRPARSRTPDR